MRPYNLIIAFVIYCLGTLASAGVAKPVVLDSGWPKEITSKGASYTVYQPQLDAWDGYSYKAHAAIAVKESGAENSLYGVIVFEALTHVNKTERMVTFEGLEIKSARFPSAPKKQENFRQSLQLRLADVVRVIALDRVEAGLALLDAQKSAAQIPVKNDAPNIVFSYKPAVLIYVDGDPVYESIQGFIYHRVLNTRVLLLKDKRGMFYLRMMEGWLRAPAVTGPWEVVDKNPVDIDKAMKVSLANRPADLLEDSSDVESTGTKTADSKRKDTKGTEGKVSGENVGKERSPTLKEGPVPVIVSATEPTELLVFDGEPNYVSIANTQLLFADNTTGHAFLHLTDQHLYLLISGRWYRGAGPEGPWKHVTQKMLPGDFGRISDDSPKENVKASVAGTAQAQEALIANSIPETAEVKRAEAKFKLTLDGKAKWVRIESTDLYRVENSPDPIIRVSKNALYALYNGVWFSSASLEGPWHVADTIPAAIYAIPASSPIHNVTYVRVYDASPDIVVVGYTPGYYGTVVVNGVVVYGTGYYYSPWIGSAWYGYPMTYGWGSGITYSPWAGWSYTFGVGYGWGYWGSPWWGPYPYPYWGPYYGYSYGYGYGYPSYYGGAVYGPGGSGAVWGPGGWAGTTGNVYHRWGDSSAVTRASGGYNAYSGKGWRNQVGVAYNSRTGTLAAGQRAAVANVYSGDYAYGKRGVAGNREAGIVAAGSKGTLGNVNTGKEISAARGVVRNANTGKTTKVGGAKGERGSVGRVGDNVFGSKDGEVYRRSGKDNWEKVNRQGDWNRVKSSDRKRSLDRQHRARSSGSNRAHAQKRSRQSAGSFSRGSRGGGGARRGGGGLRR